LLAKLLVFAFFEVRFARRDQGHAALVEEDRRLLLKAIGIGLVECQSLVVGSDLVDQRANVGSGHLRARIQVGKIFAELCADIRLLLGLPAHRALLGDLLRHCGRICELAILRLCDRSNPRLVKEEADRCRDRDQEDCRNQVTRESPAGPTLFPCSHPSAPRCPALSRRLQGPPDCLLFNGLKVDWRGTLAPSGGRLSS